MKLTHGWAAAVRSLEVMSLPTAYLSCMHYFCRCAPPPPGPPSRLPAASPQVYPTCLRVSPIILTGGYSPPPFNLSPPCQPVGRSACLVQSLQYQNKCPTCNAPAKRRDMRSCEQVDAILGHFAVLKSEGCVPVTQ